MRALAFVLHILGAVVWVGGMFAIYTCLRPALVTLEPVRREHYRRANNDCARECGLRGRLAFSPAANIGRWGARVGADT